METTLYADVLEKVEEKVDEIALYFQDHLGIKSGDQPPELAISMYEAERILANLITQTLEFEMGDD